MSNSKKEKVTHLINPADILKRDDRTYERIHVDVWGGDVIVQSLTAGERDKFESSLMVGRGKNQRVSATNMRAKLVVMSVVDEEHNLMFTESDIATLSGKNAAALDQIFTVACRLSGISDGEIEELEGN